MKENISTILFYCNMGSYGKTVQPYIEPVIQRLPYMTFWGQNSHSMWLAHSPDPIPCNYRQQGSLQDEFIKTKQHIEGKHKETIKCAVLTISIKNFEQFLGFTFIRCPACLINKWAHFQHLLQ